MTREEAIESGVLDALTWGGACEGLEETARYVELYFGLDSPDELEGFAVGLTMIAVEVVEIARKRREAAAEAAVTT